jgi:hypothetical protein
MVGERFVHYIKRYSLHETKSTAPLAPLANETELVKTEILLLLAREIT